MTFEMAVLPTWPPGNGPKGFEYPKINHSFTLAHCALFAFEALLQVMGRLRNIFRDAEIAQWSTTITTHVPS